MKVIMSGSKFWKVISRIIPQKSIPDRQQILPAMFQNLMEILLRRAGIRRSEEVDGGPAWFQIELLDKVVFTYFWS